MFETTIAGSLPKPGWLAETGKLWPEWRTQGPELEEALDRALFDRTLKAPGFAQFPYGAPRTAREGLLAACAGDRPRREASPPRNPRPAAS